MTGAPVATRARTRPEDALQRAAILYLRSALSPAEFRILHVPNGGRRSRTEAAILKGLGTLAGVPDIEILGPLGVSYFIECKAPQGRLSREQKDFQAFCERNSVPYAVARSLDDVIASAQAWGLTRRAAA